MTVWQRITNEMVWCPPHGIKVHGIASGTDWIPAWVEIDGDAYQLGAFDKDNQTYELHPRIAAPLAPPMQS
jgi:hypothetical protein